MRCRQNAGSTGTHATTPATHNRISRLVAAGDVSTGAETVLADLPNLSDLPNPP